MYRAIPRTGVGGSKEKRRTNVDVPSDAVFSLISSRFVTVTSHFRYSSCFECIRGTRVYISLRKNGRSYSGLEIYTDIGLGLGGVCCVLKECCLLSTAVSQPGDDSDEISMVERFQALMKQSVNIQQRNQSSQVVSFPVDAGRGSFEPFRVLCCVVAEYSSLSV